MEKSEKRGFWATLFLAKPCKCACNGKGNAPAAQVEPIGQAVADPKAIKEIKVLGPGCAKCKSTFATIEKVVKANGLAAVPTKVEDIEEIMRYNIMATPAIVIDGKVVSKGKVPTEAEVEKLLGL